MTLGPLGGEEGLSQPCGRAAWLRPAGLAGILVSRAAAPSPGGNRLSRSPRGLDVPPAAERGAPGACGASVQFLEPRWPGWLQEAGWPTGLRGLRGPCGPRPGLWTRPASSLVHSPGVHSPCAHSFVLSNPLWVQGWVLRGPRHPQKPRAQPSALEAARRRERLCEQWSSGGRPARAG